MTSPSEARLTECPRDAMQGIGELIPTGEKVRYLNSLLRVGFDILDFGSFVSPKAIPQMADTVEVLKGLDWKSSHTRLLAIIGNERGAVEAVVHEGIAFLGYPYSLSETFGRRNTNKSPADAKSDVRKIGAMAKEADKRLLVYLSMGFGNPYGDAWNIASISDTLEELMEMGISHFRLADTTAVASAELIGEVFAEVLSRFLEAEIGAHLHSTPDSAAQKVEAAWDAGCRIFDTAMLGFGGCPMATDELTGNIDTLTVIASISNAGGCLGLDHQALENSRLIAADLFSRYH